MGTGAAPNYANLFMDRFGTEALENYPLKPMLWLRFIDDIFMIWTHGEDHLMNLITYLNSIHSSIKFTHEQSHQTVNSLHIDENRRIYTTLYEKPTDTHLYLHYTSSHHDPCKSKGLYGQYLRLRRICTKVEDFRYNSKRLTEFYIKRGYPIKSLTKHFNRANKYKQDDLLDIKPRETTEIPVMVTNYNPQNPDIRNLIMCNWNIRSNSQDCGHLSPKPPILGYKRLPNLRDLMINAEIHFPK